MLFLSSEMIKEAEKLTMQEVSSLYLIENAANACFRELCSFNSVRVYCGKGNNGSDGYATALLLKKSGIYVEIVQVFPPASEECATLCQRAIEADIPVTQEVTFPTEEVDCVFDAIFGIGINGEITDARALRAIEIINSSESYVVSADIPSGMNADSGEECGASVKADKTVTFTAPKRGMLSNKSVDLCGEIVVAEVGIRVKYDELRESTCVPITGKLVKSMLPKRERYSHKGTFGTTVIVAGSKTMPGAAAMAAMAAYKSGCGVVKIIAPVSICQVLNILVKEAIVIPQAEENGVMKPNLSEEGVNALAKADSVLIGPGLGKGRHSELIENVLNVTNAGVIIDADGINALAGKLDIIRNKNVLLTPHVLEFSRISGCDVKDIESRRISFADKFARENGVTLLLKGARTVIAYGGSNKYISLDATSALAKAGSGDVLGGIIASLSSQGMSLTDSAAAGCYIHTHTGLIAEKEVGARGTTADDLIKFIPQALREM